VSWQRIGAVNSRYEWVEQTLGVTLVDPNIWVDDWNFGRNYLHINRGGARHMVNFTPDSVLLAAEDRR